MKSIMIFLISISAIFSQNEIEKLNFISENSSASHNSFISVNNEDFYFWAQKDTLFYIIEKEDSSWEGPFVLDTTLSQTLYVDQEINVIEGENGKLIITYKGNKFISRSSSDGRIWSEPVKISSVTSNYAFGYSNLFYNEADNSYWFTFSSSYILNNYPNKNLIRLRTVDPSSWNGTIDTVLSVDRARIGKASFLKYEEKTTVFFSMLKEGNYSICKSESLNNGTDWTDVVPLLESEKIIKNVSAIKDSAGRIWLVYESETESEIEGIVNQDINFMYSDDNGSTWSESQRFTDYDGSDINPSLALKDGEPYVVFSSPRIRDYSSNDCKGYSEDYDKCYFNKLYAGVPENSDDPNTPPLIINYRLTYFSDYPYVIPFFEVNAYDKMLKDVKLQYSVNNGSLQEITLKDDGLSGDNLAGDFVFSGFANSLYLPDTNNVMYNIIITDNADSSFATGIKSSPSVTELNESYAFNINDIYLPVDNKGILGDTDPMNEIGKGGKFEESGFLFSGGFFMSGLDNGQIWSNGVLSAARIEDYIPGKFGYDEDFSLFIVTKYDSPFGKSWKDWSFAVNAGADFYDGDGDGKYIPLDKNANGFWDENEDKPGLPGDAATWCVYNDNLPSSLRRYSTVAPKGIEIRQTVWGYSPETNPELSRVLFVKYKISNTGDVSELYDSVYFAPSADPDLGEPFDDLVGCDTQLKSGFTYNWNDDSEYGINPPAFFISQLQGPVKYLPGVSFVDKNDNGIYDEGIDSALTFASINNAGYGRETIEGAINIDPAAFTQYMSANIELGDPFDPESMRNYLTGGKFAEGQKIDPCDSYYGEVIPESECGNINPVFNYSGDPVERNGWINTSANDQRMLLSTGPFTLEAGKPVELIYAYIVGRGTDNLNSITEARKTAQDVLGFYSTNFTSIPVDVKETAVSSVPKNFVLYQNYPNPFNPVTTIDYSIPTIGARSIVPVRLKIFNLLGQEVATLVNEQQPAGNYEVKFDASAFSSGVYFYRLEAGSFSSVKKLMLLK